MRPPSGAKGSPAHPLLVPPIAASQFAPPFMISGVAVALPALGADLGAGATALSLVETLFLAAAVALLLPAGRLGDAADKATLYKLGMAAFALSSVAIGLVSSVPAILALRLLQGAGSGAGAGARPAPTARRGCRRPGLRSSPTPCRPSAAGAPTASPSARSTPASRSGRSSPASSSS